VRTSIDNSLGPTLSSKNIKEMANPLPKSGNPSVIGLSPSQPNKKTPNPPSNPPPIRNATPSNRYLGQDHFVSVDTEISNTPSNRYLGQDYFSSSTVGSEISNISNTPPNRYLGQEYSPSTTYGSEFSSQSTSVLMGFSSSKDELPLIADYREGKMGSSINSIFGASLSFSPKSGKIPIIVEECIKYLEIKGIKEEGMLRLAGSSSETKYIRETFDRGQIPNFNTIKDINSIGDVLKLYFRSLPRKPLLMTKGIKEASLMTDQRKMIPMMEDELLQIPEINYFTLKRLFGLMRAIANNANYTLMSPENIAIVFHPTLQIPQSIITLLITQPQVWVK